MSSRPLTVLIAILTSVVSVASAPTALAAPRIVPPGKTLVVAGQAVEPAVSGSMRRYARTLGGHPAGFAFYSIMSGDVQRTRRELATMGAFLRSRPGCPSGSRPARPGCRDDAVLQLGLGYGAGITANAEASRALLAGVYDAELDVIARWLRSLPNVVLLRPLYEFDRVGDTYGPPALARRAYRYIVDRLRRADVDNVSYVWHAAGPGPQTSSPLRAFYPGRRYVDYFALSYWGDVARPSGLGSPKERADYRRRWREQLGLARTLRLPTMIAESTPAYVGTTSGARSIRWLRDAFAQIRRADVRVFTYIAAAWRSEGGVWSEPFFYGFFPPDARLLPRTDVWTAWRRLTASPRYLHTAADAARVLRYRADPVPFRLSARPEPVRPRLRYPNCTPPDEPASGGWCLPPLPGRSAAAPAS